MHKTIDENLIVNKILSARKANSYNRIGGHLDSIGGGVIGDETIEDRMRIFEDEIIKRIKIIQNFVKNLDGKLKTLKSQSKHHHTSQNKSQAQLSSSRMNGGGSVDEPLMTLGDDRKPERLRDLLLDEGQAPMGASHQQQAIIKEAVKWELEIMERKTEDRFREMEQLIKKVGVKIDKSSASIVQDTTNEF